MPEFSVPGDLSPDHLVAAKIIDGEKQLLTQRIRHKQQELKRLLHEDFEEVGASGRN